MPSHTELLRACIDRPDDDAPRHAYAEALSAEGDPRGTFIQLQLRAAQAQSGGMPSALWRAWEQDAQDLLEVHGQAWRATVCPPCTQAIFHRGLVEHVSMSARDFLDKGEALLALAPIRHLDLTGLSGLASTLFASPLLTRIQSLGLDHGGLGDKEVTLLAASPHLQALQWLDLQRNDIGMAGARALAASNHLPQLRYVEFFANQVAPTEKFFTDQGVIVDSELPPDGLALESEFGHLPWLHIDAQTTRDIPPARY